MKIIKGECSEIKNIISGEIKSAYESNITNRIDESIKDVKVKINKAIEQQVKPDYDINVTCDESNNPPELIKKGVIKVDAIIRKRNLNENN